MPESKHYVVKETREVKVAAFSPSDAVIIAAAAFANGQDADGGVARGKGPEGVWGNTTSRISTTNIAATED